MSPNYILVVFTNVVMLSGAITLFFNGFTAKMTGYILMIVGSLFSLVTISNQLMKLDAPSVAGMFILYLLIMGMISMMIYLRRKYRAKLEKLENNNVKQIASYETYLAIVYLIMMSLLGYITHIMGRPSVVLSGEDMSKFAMVYLLSCVALSIGIAFTNLIRIIMTRFVTDGFATYTQETNE